MSTNLRFDYNGMVYSTTASLYLSKLDKTVYFNAIMDTGCTYTSMNLTDLLTLLEVSLADFKKLYPDFDETSYTSYTSTGNNIVVKTKRIRIPKFKLGLYEQSMRIDTFYCDLLLPSFSSDRFEHRTYDVLPTGGRIKPKLFIGNDIITSCQSLTCYERYAYMCGFDENKYLTKARSRTNIVYNFCSLFD